MSGIAKLESFSDLRRSLIVWDLRGRRHDDEERDLGLAGDGLPRIAARCMLTARPRTTYLRGKHTTTSN